MLPAVASISVAPGRSCAAALGVVDDGPGDAVLDAAAGVEVLALAQDRADEPLPDAPQRHQRRRADSVQQDWWQHHGNPDHLRATHSTVSSSSSTTSVGHHENRASGGRHAPHLLPHQVIDQLAGVLGGVDLV